MNRKIQKEPKTFLQFQLVLRMPSSTEIFADKPAQLTGVPISELMLNIQVVLTSKGLKLNDFFSSSFSLSDR